MAGPNETDAHEGSPLLHHDDDDNNHSALTPAIPHVPPATNSWPTPAGLRPAGSNDENVAIFRRALGINAQLSPDATPSSVEAGRRSASGIYAAVIRCRRTKRWQNTAVQVLVYVAHVVQIVLGATLTALGASAGAHSLLVTVFGAANTVVAGVLALLKGRGTPERLRKDALEYQRLQDWIEETESLLAMGILGRDRREVGLLVEMAFKRYNAARASEENNKPDSWVRQVPEGPQDREERHEGVRVALRRENEGLSPDHGAVMDDAGSVSSGGGNALVKLNMPRHRES